MRALPQDEQRPSLARDRAVWALVVLVVALAVPYALSGPRLILDDWFFLRNAHFDGAFSAGGARQLAGRPGSWLLYAFQFGVVGRRPMALYALQTAANAAVAVALFAAARRFVSRRLALAVAVVWVLLPNHASLSRWFSTFPAVVALVLVLVGIIVLDAGRRPWLAICCFAAAALCYEAVIPAAMLALVAVSVARRRRVGADVLAGLLVLALITQWAWMHRLYPEVKRAKLGVLFPIHFGTGIAASTAAGVALALVAGVALTVALVRLALPSFRSQTGQPERLVLAGLVIIGAGSAAFFRWPWTVTGINDRANLIGSIGAATAWVGIALMVGRVRRQLAVAGAIVVALLVVPAHFQRDDDYRRAGNEAARLLAVAKRAPLTPDRAVMLDPWAIRSHHEVYGLFDWMTPHAVQLVRNDPTVTARFIQSSKS
jgi:hypothetical protein